jgi:hypothetical protein
MELPNINTFEHIKKNLKHITTYAKKCRKVINTSRIIQRGGATDANKYNEQKITRDLNKVKYLFDLIPDKTHQHIPKIDDLDLLDQKLQKFIKDIEDITYNESDRDDPKNKLFKRATKLSDTQKQIVQLKKKSKIVAEKLGMIGEDVFDNEVKFVDSMTDPSGSTYTSLLQLYRGITDDYDDFVHQYESTEQKNKGESQPLYFEDFAHSGNTALIDTINTYDKKITKINGIINDDIQYFKHMQAEYMNTFSYFEKNMIEIMDPSGMSLDYVVTFDFKSRPDKISPYSLGELVKYGTDLVNNTTTSLEDFVKDGVNLADDMLIESKSDEEEIISGGGSTFTSQNSFVVDRLHDVDTSTTFSKLINILYNQLRHLNELIGKYYDAFNQNEIFNENKKQFFHYVISMLTAHTILNEEVKKDKHVRKNNMTMFDYINRGYIQYYYSVVKTIKKMIDDNVADTGIYYFKRYHMVTLEYMEKFFQFVLSKDTYGTLILDNLHVIDINKCAGNAKTAFYVFNHFKDLLESFKETCQGRVSIYARINDKLKDQTLMPEQKQLQKQNEMYKVETDDVTFMTVDQSKCDPLIKNKTTVKFSEVFDSYDHVDNMAITKYMSLETQIAKKKGIMLITYGYSGVGKTFTLFGNKEKKLQGMLQATLANIKNKGEIKFRTYELYGFGVQYPYYWDDKINQQVICYILDVGRNGIAVEGTRVIYNKGNAIGEFINDADDGFITIASGRTQKETFQQFSTFVDKVDAVRLDTGRVKATPNNPSSSRSIIVYELLIQVDKEYVPFVIVDVPGREEIVSTYVDTYLSKPYIKDMKLSNANKISKDVFIKTLLSSMAINPLGLAFMEPTALFTVFNSMDEDTRKSVFLELKQIVINTEYGTKIDAVYDFVGGNFFKIVENKKFNFEDGSKGNAHIVEIVGTDKTKGRTAPRHPRHIPTLTNSVQYQNILAMFMINVLITQGRFDVLNKMYKMLIDMYFINVDTTKEEHGVEGLRKVMNDTLDTILRLRQDENILINEITWLDVYAFHCMLNDIKSNGVSAENIYKELNARHVKWIECVTLFCSKVDEIDIKNYEEDAKKSKCKMHDLFMLDKNFDKVTFHDSLSYDKIDLTQFKFGNLDELSPYQLWKKLDESLLFRAYDAPTEGIYINENIMGLMKMLMEISLSGRDNSAISKTIIKQGVISFEEQKTLLREYNFDLFKESASANTVPYENIHIDKNIIKRMHEDNKKGYSSQKIFNYDDPYVQHIFNAYNKDREFTDKITSQKCKVLKVSDFKVFYLVTNGLEHDLVPENKTFFNEKLKHQYTLFNNSRTFFEAIIT